MALVNDCSHDKARIERDLFFQVKLQFLFSERFFKQIKAVHIWVKYLPKK